MALKDTSTPPKRGAEPPEGNHQARAGVSQPTRSAPVSVLLVEADPNDALLIEKALRQTGPKRFKITHASRLLDAATFAGQGSYDVILVDPGLPGPSGLQALSALSQGDPRAAIVVLGTRDDEEQAVEAMRMGAQDYLVKSRTSPELLARAIRYAIERKAAEQERERLYMQAEAERGLLKEVVRQMQKGAIIAEAPSGAHILSSQQMRRIWRQPPADDGGPDYLQSAWHPGGAPYDPDEWPLTRALRGETVEDEEIEVLRGDGTRGLVSASAAPVRDPAGHIVAGVATFHDLTERKRIEDDLRDSRAKLELILEQMPAQLWTTDTSLRITSILGRAMTGLGLNSGQYLDETLYDVAKNRALRGAPPVPQVEAHLKALRGESATYDTELRGRLFEARVEPLRDGQGKTVGCVGLAIDVTEERRATEELARQASKLQEQAELLDLAHDSIIVRELDGSILFWNRGAEEMYGWAGEEVLGKSSHELLQTRFPRPLEEIQAELLETGFWEGELVHRRRDGGPLFVAARWSLRAAPPGSPPAILEIDNNITPRKQAEQKLLQYTERLNVLHSLDQAILAAHSSREVAETALGFLRQLVPCSRTDVILFDFPAGQAVVLALDCDGDSRLSGGARFSLREMEFVDEFREGKPFLIRDLSVYENFPAALDPLRGEGLRSCASVPLISRGQLIGALNLWASELDAFGPDHLEIAREVASELAIAVQDARLVEELTESRTRLQSLSQQLLMAQEEERRRIARELHDQIGQALTALKIGLQAARRTAGSDPAALIARLDENIGIVEQTLGQARNLSLDLRPAMLDDLGLPSALRWYLDRQTRYAGLRARLSTNLAEERLSAEIETACFRVAQEALTNVLRHSGARNVKVELYLRDGTLELAVSDDGSGFDTTASIESAVRGRSLGLLGMQERVELLGGSISIESAASQGSRIVARFPLAGRPGPVEDGRADSSREPA